MTKPLILLVDDHADIRRLIRIALGADFEVLEAEDGASAWAIVRSRRPGMVVLDIMMPGELDGLLVLKAIRSDPELASVHVVVVSARGQARDYEQGMDMGADAYFIKPFSPLLLVDRIRQLLDEKA